MGLSENGTAARCFTNKKCFVSDVFQYFFVCFAVARVIAFYFLFCV